VLLVHNLAPIMIANTTVLHEYIRAGEAAVKAHKNDAITRATTVVRKVTSRETARKKGEDVIEPRDSAARLRGNNQIQLTIRG
jgi:hypothetical protein